MRMYHGACATVSARISVLRRGPSVPTSARASTSDGGRETTSTTRMIAAIDETTGEPGQRAENGAHREDAGDDDDRRPDQPVRTASTVRDSRSRPDSRSAEGVGTDRPASFSTMLTAFGSKASSRGPTMATNAMSTRPSAHRPWSVPEECGEDAPRRRSDAAASDRIRP